MNLKSSHIFEKDVTDGKTYEFIGKHLLGTYNDCCPERLADTSLLMDTLRVAIAESGATILKECCERFPGGGWTALFLLAESHASIHTYPEVNSCFVDMFTCGLECQPELFDVHLKAYLQPRTSESRVFVRSSQSLVEQK